MIGTGTAILGAAAIGAGASLLSGKPKAQTQTTNSSSSPNWSGAEYVPAGLKSQFEGAQSLAAKPYEAYSGERVAQLTPDELQAMQLTRNLSGGADLSYSQGINKEVANRGLGGFNQATLAQYMNPYQQQVMDISKQRQLDQFDLAKRGLQQQQAQTGAFGGSRAGLAQGQLYDNFSRQLAEQEANQLYTGYTDAQNRAFQGTQLAGQAAGQYGQQALAQQQSGMQGLAALSASGAQQRGINQAGLDVGYQNFLEKQQYPYTQAQFLQGVENPIAQMTAGQTGTSTSTIPYSGPGTLGRMVNAGIGAGFTAAGMGSMGGLVGNSPSQGVMGGFANGLLGSPNVGPTATGAPMSGGTGIYRFFKDGGIVGYDNGGPVTGFAGGGNTIAGVSPSDFFAAQPARIGGSDFLTGLNGFLDSLVNDHYNRPIFTPDSTVQPSTMSAPATTGPIAGTIPAEFFAAQQRPYHLNPTQPVTADPLTQATLAPYGSNRPFHAASAPTVSAPTASGPSWPFVGQNDSVGSPALGDAAIKFAKEHPQGLAAAALMAPEIIGLGEAGVAGAGYAASKVPALLAAARNSPKLMTALRAAGALGILNSSPETPAENRAATNKAIAEAKAKQGSLGDPMAEFRSAQRVNGNLSSATGDLSSPGIMGNAQADDIFAQITGKPRTAPPAFPSASATLTATAPTQTERPYNAPLVAFGATMMGSKGNFMEALADSTKAYANERSTQDKEIAAAAQQAIKNKMEAYKALMYGQQVANSAPNPAKVAAEIAKLRAQAGSNPAAQKNFNTLMATGDDKYTNDPKATWQLASELAKSGVGNSIDDTQPDMSGITDQILQQQYFAAQPPATSE